MKPTTTRTRPPAHLDETERRLWLAIKTDFAIDDVAGQELLTVALEARMRMRRCREAIDRDGETLEGGKLNPLLSVERDRSKSFLSAIAALGLDLEPAQGMGRPVTSTTTVRRVK